MDLTIPWWVIFFFGFALGAITFSRMIRNEVGNMMVRHKARRRRYYDVDAERYARRDYD